MHSYYVEHCENLKTLRKAIQSVQITLREYISKNDESNIYVYTKILSHLINSWAEVRVLKLIYEIGAFSNAEKTKIIKCNDLKERWQMALNIAFCKAYKIRKINSKTTSFTPRKRYEALKELIDNELLESNQLRNRIAHGQWQFAFNNDLLRINEDLTEKLRKENIVRLQLRLKMFINLAQIIHDLAVSKTTFARDFDRNYRIVEEQKQNFHNRNYEDYRNKMILKRRRGLERKRTALQHQEED